MNALKFLSTKCERIVPYTSGDKNNFVRFLQIPPLCTCMASVLVSMGEIPRKKKFLYVVYFDGALQNKHSELHRS